MSRLAETMRKIVEETEGPQPCEVVECEGIDGILNVRHNQYGTFSEQTLISQNLKSAMRHSPNWQKLPADMKEALEMMATKMARILNGDFTYEDNWTDVAGYAQLIVDRL